MPPKLRGAAARGNTADPKLRGRAARGAAAADLACMYMGSTLVTPLYVLYEHEFGFSELTLTLIFAAYSLGNILSLFTFGRLSDQIGRRRTALPAIAVAAFATLVFLFAQDTPWLFVARILSGLAIGMASGAASAWVVDLTKTDKAQRGSAYTTAAIFLGVGLAPLIGGLLAQYGPAPLHLPFVLYLLVLGGLAFLVSRTKDTVEDRAESISDVSLEPRIGVPREIRGRFASPAVTAFATFAVAGFYAALAPSLLKRDMDVTNIAVAGALVASIFLAASITVRATKALSARKAMLRGAGLLIASVAVLVVAQMLQSLTILVAGALITGAAAALGYRGSLQLVNEMAPKERRAEVISSFKIVCFTGNAVPVIGVGVLSAMYSPQVATVGLAAVTAVLAVVALVTERSRAETGVTPPPALELPSTRRRG